uniref:Uncharacterized protein n=1 Tax=Trichuris muris TaxID=70415 RepID=A0A5S6Q881_TRIMR
MGNWSPATAAEERFKRNGATFKKKRGARLRKRALQWLCSAESFDPGEGTPDGMRTSLSVFSLRTAMHCGRQGPNCADMLACC